MKKLITIVVAALCLSCPEPIRTETVTFDGNELSVEFQGNKIIRCVDLETGPEPEPTGSPLAQFETSPPAVRDACPDFIEDWNERHSGD